MIPIGSPIRTRKMLPLSIRIIDGQQAQTSPGMTTRVSKLWFNDTLQAEIFAVVNVVRGDHFVRPLITYTVSDHVKCSWAPTSTAVPAMPNTAPWGAIAACSQKRGTGSETRSGAISSSNARA